jgi:DNA (cytosine-5)-methyltransferase 1
MRVLSLFSGAGGLDLGFQWAGHRIVWANDADADSCLTYSRNLGPHIVQGDIRKIDARELPSADVVIGGFPCQGFSVANWSRRADDRRNLLYKEMIRVVAELRPRFFVAENVKGLVSIAGGDALASIVREFEEVGYNLQTSILNSADYGVPQRRIRLFIVGRRRDVSLKAKLPPQATHSKPSPLLSTWLPPWVTVGDALATIPEPSQPHSLSNHTVSRYKLDFNGYLGHRPVDPLQPAPTVTARGDDLGGVVVLPHPGGKRRMSVRELATIQSFPLEFEFCGTQTSAYRQVANAVPPRLALAVAQLFPKTARKQSRSATQMGDQT